MLAMIEINLLPEEFRPRETTNLGLIGTVAVGLLVAGATLMVALDSKSDLNKKANDLQAKSQELKDKTVKVNEIKDLETEIAQKKDRQNTIIQISQSKVMWSLKLQQFSAIAQDFRGFWIEELELTRKQTAARKGSPAKEESLLRMDCGATGTSFRDVARFQDALKDEPNFFYHFADLKSNRVAVEAIEEGFNFREKLVFTVELPLRDVTSAPAKKKKAAPKPAAPPKKPAN